jgi:hypothetical protein
MRNVARIKLGYYPPSEGMRLRRLLYLNPPYDSEVGSSGNEESKGNWV